MSNSSSIDDANLPRLFRASSSRALSRGSITTSTNSRDKRGSQGGDSSGQNTRRGSTSKSSSISNIPQKRPRASAPVSMSDDDSDDSDYSGDIINKKRSSLPTKRTTLFSDDEDEQTTDANNKDKERESAFNEGNIERIKNLEYN